MLVHIIETEDMTKLESIFRSLSLLETEIESHLNEITPLPRHAKSFESNVIEKETLRLKVIKSSLDKLSEVLNSKKFQITNEI